MNMFSKAQNLLLITRAISEVKRIYLGEFRSNSPIATENHSFRLCLRISEICYKGFEEKSISTFYIEIVIYAIVKSKYISNIVMKMTESDN